MIRINPSPRTRNITVTPLSAVTPPWTRWCRWAALVGVLVFATVWLSGASSYAQLSRQPRPWADDPMPPAGLDQYAFAWRHPSSGRMPGPVGRPDGVDLEVTHISRTPTYHAYCVIYPNNKPTLCPGTEHKQRWPAPGEIVTFTGHITNQGTQASPSFDYAWAVDDLVVSSGTLSPLDPQETTTVVYHWAWNHQMVGERVLDDHTIALSVDPENVVEETHTDNNSIRDYTNAMSLKIGITPEMMEAYKQPVDPRFPSSAKNWLQRQIAAMNWALASAVYPLTPDGANMRVRLDSIEVSDSRPLVDRRHDGYWFVDADYRTYSYGYDSTTDIDWNLVHELSHQIGLIDLYRYGIFDSSNHVRDQHGLPINFSFSWARPGLMGGGDIAPYTEWYRYSSHSAAGMTATSGYRRGYYGEYQYDLPEEVVIEVLDNTGQPAADVQVTMYHRSGPVDWIGDWGVDNDPEISGFTGTDGRFVVPSRSVDGDVTTATGHTLTDNPFGVIDVVGSRNRFLINLRRDGHEVFHWLDLTSLNLAYWSGQTESVVLTYDMGFPGVAAPTAPEIVETEVQRTSQKICWAHPEQSTLAGYNVYRIGPPEFSSYERVAQLVPGPCYTHTGTWQYAVYAVTSVDGVGRESGFSSLVWQPVLGGARGVSAQGKTWLSNGDVILMEPHFGRVIAQRHDGRFVQPLTSPHLPFVGVNYISSDAQRRTYISQLDHRVRVLNAEQNPIFAIGRSGSAPGEFQNPAGIAASSAAYPHPTCTYGGPFRLDDDTLLLLHFDANFDGAAGETGSATGVTLTSGLFGLAALFESDSWLTYDTDGDLDSESGAIEFWFRPNWNGNDGMSYVLYEVGNTWFNRMRITKDGANNLRFMVWDDDTEYDASYHVSHWMAGEWHHIAVTWQAGGGIQLYVDGRLRSSNRSAQMPVSLPETMTLGAANFQSWRAEGTIDEFRISSLPRVGNSNQCQPTIFVVDSGNHRLQAFDGDGNYLAQIGHLGSGLGQFDNPQGVTIRRNGEIVVVDSGNDRLQVFTFEEHQFKALRVVTAALRAPTHIAAHGDDHLVVADTGNSAVKVLWQETLSSTYTASGDGSDLSFAEPMGVVALPDGTVVVADNRHAQLVRLPQALPPLPVDHEYALVVSTDGQGAVTRVPKQDTYRYLDLVTLTPAPNPGWTFAGWSGPHASDLVDKGDDSWDLVMDSDKSVTATFTQDEYSLDVIIVGEGDVEVEPDQDAYHYGDVITLTATAHSDWTFAGWSGDVDSTANPLELTIEGDTTVTATFEPREMKVYLPLVLTNH